MSIFRPLPFLLVCTMLVCAMLCCGCRGTQGRLMQNGETNKVGSNQAGAEVYNPLVRSTVGKLLARAAVEPVQQVAGQPLQMPKRKVCFISLENASVEELGDFKEHIKQAILEGVSQSDQFEIVSDRAVESGLRALNFRPNDLFMRENMMMFTSAMGSNGEPVDYLLFGKITSGTTQDNKDIQRDYKLSLELINTKTYVPIIESTPIRKEYNNSLKGKIGGWFKK